MTCVDVKVCVLSSNQNRDSESTTETSKKCVSTMEEVTDDERTGCDTSGEVCPLDGGGHQNITDETFKIKPFYLQVCGFSVVL